MKQKLLKLLIIATLFILPTTYISAATSTYLPFAIQGGSDQTTKFNDYVVKSNNAHWGYTEEYWSKGNGTNTYWTSEYGGTKKTRLNHDGIVLGDKQITATSSSGGHTKYTKWTYYSTSDDNGDELSWDDKYIIIESKECIKTVTLQTDVYTSAVTTNKFFWGIYLTNDVDNWGDVLWDGGKSWNLTESNRDKKYKINETIDLSAKPNYNANNKYLVICYAGNFSGVIQKLVINENTYLNVATEPGLFTATMGGYETRDLVVSFGNLDGTANTSITHFEFTSDNSVFTYEGESGDNMGLLKIGERRIAIRYSPIEVSRNDTAHITIKAGTAATSLSRTITVIGHSRTAQKILWNQKFSNLDISESDITLTATSSAGLTPIVYTSNDPSIVKIVDGKLHIVGKGRTTIEASQAGNGEYAPASMTKYVYVSEPGDPCEAYDLYEPSHITLHTIDAQEYELMGMPADSLYFEACRTIDAITRSAGRNHFRVAYSVDGGAHYHDFADFNDMARSEGLGIIGSWTKYKLRIPDEKATHIKIYTETGATMRHHIRNVIVTQKSYLRPTATHFEMEPRIGSTSYNATLRIAYSNIIGNIDLALKTSSSIISIDHTEIPISCGDADTVNVNIRMTDIPCTEIHNSIIMSANGGKVRVELPLIVRPLKGFQTILWTSAPTDVNTSSELNVSDMGGIVAPRSLQPIYTSDNPDIADFDIDGNLIIKQPGDVTIRASYPEDDCYNAAPDVTKTISIAQAHLIFDDKDADKDWFNANNWKPNRNVIPNHLAFATLEADVEIDDTKIAYAKRLTLDSHHLTIKADGNLHAETIIGAVEVNPALIYLEAGDATHSAGALATKSTDVNARVDVFVEGTNKGSETTWQYFGVPYTVRATPSFYGAWVCEWSEKIGNWSYKNTNDYLDPWVGYCITQDDALTRTYSYEPHGVLQTGNHTYTLTKTKDSSYEGNNIVTNSYTAPIDITKLTDADFDNAEKTIYIYNTGSYTQWDKYYKDGAVSRDALAGQYLAIPALEAEYAPYDITVIPPMQAFCLQAKADNATFTVNYDRAIWGSTSSSKPKRINRRNMPSIEENENLIIDIQGSHYADAISVLKRSNCTSEYDDGHDAHKWEGSKQAPQLYSIEDDDKIYAVDARETLEGHYIGLRPGEDNYYTLTFRLVDTDDFYYLKDLSDNSYYPIIEGMSVDIAAETTMSRRFQIVSEIEYEDAINDQPHGVTTDICMNNATAFMTNSTDNIVTANIYDMTGKLIGRQDVAPHTTFNYQFDQLPRGTYIINLGTQNLKIVR